MASLREISLVYTNTNNMCTILGSIARNWRVDIVGWNLTANTRELTAVIVNGCSATWPESAKIIHTRKCCSLARF